MTTKCTGCGVCTEGCPSRKVALRVRSEPLTTAALSICPLRRRSRRCRSSTPQLCIHFKTGKCGLCKLKCSAGAIDFEQKDEVIEKQYGAIVVATGFNPINPSRTTTNWAMLDNKDVITSLELERLMNAAGPTKGTLLRPSDGKHPKTIVFVQCVGSRCDASTRARPTAPRSAVCTPQSMRC